MNCYALFKKAVLRRPLEPGQYVNFASGATLRDSGVLASMGSRGDAYDNAAAESFFSTIKRSSSTAGPS